MNLDGGDLHADGEAHGLHGDIKRVDLCRVSVDVLVAGPVRYIAHLQVGSNSLAFHLVAFLPSL